MTDSEMEGIRRWAEACWEEDWLNERRWWTRLCYWACLKFAGIHLGWTGPDELASSIMSYAENYERAKD